MTVEKKHADGMVWGTLRPCTVAYGTAMILCSDATLVYSPLRCCASNNARKKLSDARERGSESAGSCAPRDLPGKSCNADLGGVSQLLSSSSAKSSSCSGSGSSAKSGG